MYEQIISARDEGQRIDKYLHKLLPGAGTAFLYKMLRKKNITLNDKKASGSEKLVQGDSVKVYFAKETLEKFMKTGSTMPRQTVQIPAISVIYENEHFLFVNKPAGVLSQKAKPEDYSANDWILDYLAETEHLSGEQIRTFRPCVCNRLDRNTSGLLLCAKTVKGAQFLSDALKNRSMEKYYIALVKGCVKEELHLQGYLVKDEDANKVFVSQKQQEGGVPIETSYEIIRALPEHSLLKVHLMTGKSHQIRAHLAGIGHPIIGDAKYGDRKTNRLYRERYGITAQMLHAWQVCFPDGKAELGIEPGQVFIAEIPQLFSEL